ncbi:hypothetical protein BDFB_002529 [Asbolus verrucosus]|uniref:Uncharacterized protein n=1 Tax=Asbolus verrucosus TaxID=1661398 RepID=A0A482VMY4_ASBVE|nr:hypothetical protein BDFB_002529 [Asbolus verrucosus]
MLCASLISGKLTQICGGRAAAGGGGRRSCGCAVRAVTWPHKSGNAERGDGDRSG